MSPIPLAGRPLVLTALVAGLALPFGVLLAAAAPRPDQAAVVSRADAKLAVSLLSRESAVVNLCEPCGATAPEFQPFEQATAGPWEPDPALWEVRIDGEPKDLAYLYVPLAHGDDGVTFVNVAHLLGLTVVDVSPVLTLPEGHFGAD